MGPRIDESESSPPGRNRPRRNEREAILLQPLDEQRGEAIDLGQERFVIDLLELEEACERREDTLRLRPDDCIVVRGVLWGHQRWHNTPVRRDRDPEDRGGETAFHLTRELVGGDV